MSTLIKFLPFDASTQANCIAWSQGISTSLATFGWTKSSDLGQINFGTIPQTFDKDVPSTLQGNFRGAYSGGSTYNGTTSDGGLCDVVTSGGATWICVAASTSGITPGTDNTKWRMYNYEIWKSTDALSSTNTIYFKIVYAATSAFGSPISPKMFVTISTGSDGNGNPTGNIWNQPFSGSPLGTFTGYGSGQGTSLFECDFGGSTGRFCMAMWRSAAQAGTQTCILNIERSHNNTGADTDAYVTLHTIFSANIGSGLSQSIFKQGTGSFNIRQGPKFNTIWLDNGLASYALAAGFPTFPIFPIVGAVGNPHLGIMATCAGDINDGALVNVNIYGANHEYLFVKQPGVNGISSNGSGSAVGIRWE